MTRKEAERLAKLPPAEQKAIIAAMNARLVAAWERLDKTKNWP